MKGLEFEKYANLVRKYAHYYADKWQFDYEELEAQGFLIYCECLENFDISKGCKFSTHLCWQLKRLCDYCALNKRQFQCELYDDFNNEIEPDKSYVESVSDNYIEDNIKDLLNSAIESLSETAYKILVWIISKTWEQKYRKTPSMSLVMNTFNLNQNEVCKYWNEIKNYWNNEGIYCYA